jgi:hypothetical protein
MPPERWTPKEVQVATLLWHGLTSREIGKIPTEQVIKNLLRGTFDKPGVWSRSKPTMDVCCHPGRKELAAPG